MALDYRAPIAKVNSRGTVWTSMTIAYGTYAYKMERFGSTKRDYSTIDEIVVRPCKGGWHVTLYGDPVTETLKHKTEAQREAEKLLDNPRDKHGWILQNTGHLY